MIRYFYTDPLAAAWMAKHFGMRLYCRNDDAEMAEYELSEDQREYPFEHAMIDDGCTAEMWGAVIHESLGRRAYVHPDSLPLLTPQVGDIVLNCDDDPARVVPTAKPQYGHYEAPLRHAVEFVGSGSATIIQRDGKAFNWPESEEA